MDENAEVHIAIILYGCSRSSEDKLPLEHYSCTLHDLSEIVVQLQTGKEIEESADELADELPFFEDDIDDLCTALARLRKGETYAFGCAMDGHPVAFASSKSIAFTEVKLFHAEIDFRGGRVMFYVVKKVKDATEEQKTWEDVKQPLSLGVPEDYFVPGMKEDEVYSLNGVVDMKKISIWVSDRGGAYQTKVKVVVTKDGSLFISEDETESELAELEMHQKYDKLIILENQMQIMRVLQKLLGMKIVVED